MPKTLTGVLILHHLWNKWSLDSFVFIALSASLWSFLRCHVTCFVQQCSWSTVLDFINRGLISASALGCDFPFPRVETLRRNCMRSQQDAMRVAKILRRIALKWSQIQRQKTEFSPSSMNTLSAPPGDWNKLVTWFGVAAGSPTSRRRGQRPKLEPGYWFGSNLKWSITTSRVYLIERTASEL